MNNNNILIMIPYLLSYRKQKKPIVSFSAAASWFHLLKHDIKLFLRFAILSLAQLLLDFAILAIQQKKGKISKLQIMMKF